MWILTDEQQLIQDSAARLLSAEYAFDARRQRLADGQPFSAALWQQFAELGWLGIAFDEADGGFGGGIAEHALLMREFGRRLVVEPYLETVVLGGGLVASGASPERRAELMAGIMEGRTQLAVAVAEPESRYDLHRVRTTARADGDSYVLDGRKAVVLNGRSADYLIVAARTSGDVDAERGITLFVVSGDAPGVARTGYRLNDDHHAADVVLSGVRATAADVIGDVGDGFAHLEAVVDQAIVGACAEAVGAMEAVMDMTVEYLKTREQFGRPIATNQALKFIMVDLHYALEESRSMVAGAVEAMDGDPAARRAIVSAAKVRVGNAARRIGQEGIQLHGAIGMTEDYAVGHFYKRLETLRMVFGDPDHHLARFGRWQQARNRAA